MTQRQRGDLVKRSGTPNTQRTAAAARQPNPAKAIAKLEKEIQKQRDKITQHQLSLRFTVATRSQKIYERAINTAKANKARAESKLNELRGEAWRNFGPRKLNQHFNNLRQILKDAIQDKDKLAAYRIKSEMRNMVAAIGSGTLPTARYRRRQAMLSAARIEAHYPASVSNPVSEPGRQFDRHFIKADRADSAMASMDNRYRFQDPRLRGNRVPGVSPLSRAITRMARVLRARRNAKEKS